MSFTVTMPQLGESVTEGTIAKWLKQPGEHVAKYESIAEVVTDKVNAEIPAPADGSMGDHIAPEGAVVAIGEPICTFETADAGAAQSAWAQSEKPVRAPEAAQATGEQSAVGSGVALDAGAAPTGGSEPNGQEAGGPVTVPPPPVVPEGVHLTPAVRMLLREHGVDVREVVGTGIGGRVTKKDVLEFVQGRDSGRQAPVPATISGSVPSPAGAPLVPGAPLPGLGDTVVPLTPMRRAIAEHMVRSKLTSPHAWMMMEVDMTAIVRLRSDRKREFAQRYGVDLTFLPFVARATVEALQQFPTLNATWTDQGIVLKREVHLGIAVALEDNLIVPVVRNAERLTIAGLAQTMVDLGSRSRSNRLKVEEIQGGTFTLNNTGSLGTVLTQAIINQPQAAILAMDSIIKRPVVVADDAIAVRSMMNICLSFDHRINDGLAATRFLRVVKQILEAVGPETQLL